jgi:hypothetical protein
MKHVAENLLNSFSFPKFDLICEYAGRARSAIIMLPCRASKSLVGVSKILNPVLLRRIVYVCQLGRNGHFSSSLGQP